MYQNIFNFDNGQKIESIMSDTFNIERDREVIRRVLTSTYFIEWLEKFTVDKTVFTTDEWLHQANNIGCVDIVNVKLLGEFFKMIQDYAIANYEYGTKTDFRLVYHIKYNEIGYEVGMMENSNTFFCRRSQQENLENYIPFHLIMNGEKTSKAQKLDNFFNKLTSCFDQLYTEGIPTDIIANETNKCLIKATKAHRKK